LEVRKSSGHHTYNNKNASAKWFPLTEVLLTFAERVATPCSTKRGARPAKQDIKPYVLVELQV